MDDHLKEAMIDLTGQRFMMFVVLRRVDDMYQGKPRMRWLCQCDCGNTVTLPSYHWERRMSCGCVPSLFNTNTHGAWKGMIQRCGNPNNPGYANYGGRGIKVCHQWLKIEQFFKDMGRCPDGFSLDRIDTNGNYTPENCRWASRQTQNENRRWTVWIEFNGLRKTRAQWAREIGTSTGALKGRLRSGWPIHKAVTLPPYARTA